jgi:cell division protein ZapE
MNKTLTEIYNDKLSKKLINYDDNQSKAVALLEKLNDDFSKNSARILPRIKKKTLLKGFYFWGGVGRGKSMIMDLFYKNASVKNKRRVHFHAFMQEIHEEIHLIRKSGVKDAIEPIARKISKNLKLLCFDELQITDITDAMIVGRLMELLTKNGVVIVSTSNRPPDDLYKDGLNRDLFLPFISFLKENMEVFEFSGSIDYRQLSLSDKTRFFTPINLKNKSEINALWNELTDGISTQLKLKVKSREVIIPAFCNGVGRANFNDLCEKPLGPSDFLAIAKSVRVLIIENIPKLSREKNNQAKRFVTLIDALYEQKVILIASAEATPLKLYEKGTGSFEFERTASRIKEMQSESWAS